jgi:hypothetical protein
MAKMRIATALALSIIATPVLAEQQWLSAKDFMAEVSGRATQIFTLDGALYGTEYFLPKQRTIWQLAGESQCVQGAWAIRGDLVCFRYEGGFGSCIKYYMSADTIVSVDWAAGKPTATTYNLKIVNDLPPSCIGN